jgi:CRP/FNR family transcriptional regulator, cyclic AMP receptor protein
LYISLRKHDDNHIHGFLISSASAFVAGSFEVLKTIALGASYKKVPAGEVIFNEGAVCCFYHQLVSGSVRWINIDDEGNEFIQNMIEPGECFGEMPLFDEEPYAATAIAETDTVIIRLHRSLFQQLLLERPDIHFAFTKLMSQRLRFKFLLLKELAHHDPEQSISSLLGYLKQKKKNICTKCNKVNLTRQQIANMTGLRVETVIRTIRHLHDKGSLVIEKGKVYYA